MMVVLAIYVMLFIISMICVVFIEWEDNDGEVTSEGFMYGVLLSLIPVVGQLGVLWILIQTKVAKKRRITFLSKENITNLFNKGEEKE